MMLYGITSILLGGFFQVISDNKFCGDDLFNVTVIGEMVQFVFSAPNGYGAETGFLILFKGKYSFKASI